MKDKNCKDMQAQHVAVAAEADGVPEIPGLVLPPSRHRVYCGDIDIRIDREGRWHYQGSPIGRKEMVCLFASTLQRDANGDYWMVTPAEVGRITVDDAPFMAVEMFVSGQGADGVISFRTNVDEIIALGVDNPLEVVNHPDTGEPSPYVEVRGGLRARLSRSVFYELVDRAQECNVDGEDVYGVWSQSLFFPLGPSRED
ncbi:MAG: DUF1285 domain-containing protein [Rhodospirillales bacterium]|nr:DUF1285 domain-containing protein [Rhodospirillales bacterium]MCW8952998.1 DUF1285 domain-containing protein [Rhodospirillales bacterium]MCW9002072.1 DUF1285 domain-containing protein [Rhodospirillales bacterium]